VRIIETPIPGVLIIEPRVFTDGRGYFLEQWNADRYARAGATGTYVQDNVSYSTRGVLRGLHFQHPHGQAKLVAVTSGEAYDVVVDVRRGSPTFGQWTAVVLSAENHRQLLIPSGFAHGFVVTGDHAIVCYKASDYYDPDTEKTLRWNDPSVGVDWPIASPLLSARDADGKLLEEFAASELPTR
jgi:dTDP-4-dehydrorhamnose 3,5-epimerase